MHRSVAELCGAGVVGKPRGEHTLFMLKHLLKASANHLPPCAAAAGAQVVVASVQTAENALPQLAEQGFQVRILIKCSQPAEPEVTVFSCLQMDGKGGPPLRCPATAITVQQTRQVCRTRCWLCQCLQLIIVDEAHHAPADSYVNIFEGCLPACLLPTPAGAPLCLNDCSATVAICGPGGSAAASVPSGIGAECGT